jgi:hypothetical protein
MFNRFCFGALLLACLALTFTGCNATSGLDSIQVTPATASMAVGGGTLQLTATGTFGNAAHPTTQNITSLVTWASSITGVATVSSSGVVTAVGAGTTNITASAPGFNGPLSASATVTVTGAGTGTGTSGIVSLAIIPASQSVAAPGDTSQFIAIGTTSSGSTVNLTGLSTWSSSSTTIATVGSPEKTGTVPGLATAVTQGTVTVTALYTNPVSLTVVAGMATVTVVGGTTEQITALSIVPSSQTLSASGQTGQFIALGTNGSTGLQTDVTNSSQLKWISGISSIATITTYPASPAGLAAGVYVGTTDITAQWTNTDHSVVTSPQATVTVTSTPAPEPLLSLTIIPSAISVGDLQDTGNFLAIGTFSTVPTVMDVTNGYYHSGFPDSTCTAALAATGSSPCKLVPVTWLSSFPDSFPVNSNSGGTSSASAGIVTAYASGNATIIAEASSTDGTIQTATATFSCPFVLPNPNGNPPTPGSCNVGQVGPLKATLTVYGEGLNTTNWLVTADSATGTPNVIHCGPGWASNGGTGGSVCTGIYPIGRTVILTAPAQTGVSFGGWTYNCTPIVPINQTGPNSCTIVLGATNATVGAIFN